MAIAAKLLDGGFLGFAIEGGDAGDRRKGNLVGVAEVGDGVFKPFIGGTTLASDSHPQRHVLIHLLINGHINVHKRTVDSRSRWADDKAPNWWNSCAEVCQKWCDRQIWLRRHSGDF
jgi:hypothetical protein